MKTNKFSRNWNLFVRRRTIVCAFNAFRLCTENRNHWQVSVSSHKKLCAQTKFPQHIIKQKWKAVSLLNGGIFPTKDMWALSPCGGWTLIKFSTGQKSVDDIYVRSTAKGNYSLRLTCVLVVSLTHITQKHTSYFWWKIFNRFTANRKMAMVEMDIISILWSVFPRNCCFLYALG